MNQKLVVLIEDAALARGEKPIPRRYIIKALEKIESGEKEVEQYPGGAPSLKEVFEIAVKYFEERCRSCNGKGRKYVVDRVVQGQDYGPSSEGHFEICPQCGGSGSGVISLKTEQLADN